jgi:hypothetical protein
MAVTPKQEAKTIRRLLNGSLSYQSKLIRREYRLNQRVAYAAVLNDLISLEKLPIQLLRKSSFQVRFMHDNNLSYWFQLVPYMTNKLAMLAAVKEFHDNYLTTTILHRSFKNNKNEYKDAILLVNEACTKEVARRLFEDNPSIYTTTMCKDHDWIYQLIRTRPSLYKYLAPKCPDRIRFSADILQEAIVLRSNRDILLELSSNWKLIEAIVSHFQFPAEVYLHYGRTNSLQDFTDRELRNLTVTVNLIMSGEFKQNTEPYAPPVVYPGSSVPFQNRVSTRTPLGEVNGL